MEKLSIADITLKQASKGADYSLSFLEILPPVAFRQATETVAVHPSPPLVYQLRIMVFLTWQTILIKSI